MIIVEKQGKTGKLNTQKVGQAPPPQKNYCTRQCDGRERTFKT